MTLVLATAIGTTAGAQVTPPQGVDLAALVAEAEASNPEILAARSRKNAVEHLPSQAEALPDPQAGVSYTNDGLTGFTLGSSTDTELTFSWTQEVPYPGKRRLAGDVARAEVVIQGEVLEGTRLRVRAEVEAAYAELVRLDRTQTILEESRKLLASFHETARARYETGHGILENILKAETELTKIDAELATLGQERRMVEVSLGALLGRPGEASFGPAGSPPEVETADLASLEKAALDRSPDLRALRLLASREEKRIDLARKNLKPDFAWTAAYTNRGGLDPMVTGALGIRLPLYRQKKQSQTLLQTQLEREAVLQDVESRKVRILSEVRGLVARAERTRTLMRLYEEGILPQARSALDAASASYSVGRAEFFTLLDDFRAVLGYEIAHEAQRAELITALSRLGPLTGISLVRPGVRSIL